MGKKWPQEVIDWLEKNVPGKTVIEVTELINKQGFDVIYGITFTNEQIKNAKTRYNIKSGTKGGMPKGYSSKYPPEMEEYVRSIAKGRYTSEIANMVQERFEIKFSASECKSYKSNHMIHSGITGSFQKGHIPHNKGKHMSPEAYKKCKPTMFKEGHTPANKMKVGEYTHTTDGYLIQKIQEKGAQQERFAFVHRKIWEEHNGPIPPGHKIIFLDGDKDNCTISNLAMIDNADAMEMRRRKLRTSDAELTKAGVTVARVNIAARKRKKGEK